MHSIVVVARNILLFSFMFLGLQSVVFAQESWTMEAEGKFEKLTVFGRMEVQLVADGSGVIKVTASGLEKDAVKVSFDGNTCTIKGNNLLKSADNFDVKVTVGYDVLNYISSAGGSKVYSNEILDVVNTEIDVQSGGHFESELAGEKVDFTIGQGAKVLLFGEVAELVVNANTGGYMDARDVQVTNAEVKINTGSIIELGTISETLKGKSNTGANLSYVGTPKQVQVKTTLGGTLEAR